ncbi:hypothetical protein V2J09_019326 [Rumex salicifolius]
MELQAKQASRERGVNSETSWRSTEIVATTEKLRSTTYIGGDDLRWSRIVSRANLPDGEIGKGGWKSAALDR